MPDLRNRSVSLLASLTLASTVLAASAAAQERQFWEQGDSYGDQRRAAPSRQSPRRDDSYRAPEGVDGPPGGFGRQAGSDGRPPDGSTGYGDAPPATVQRPQSYGAPAYDQRPSYDQRPTYDQRPAHDQRPADTWRPPGGQPPPQRGQDAYQPQADRQGGWNDGRGQGGYSPPPATGYQTDNGGYGQPYAPPPGQDGPPPGSYGDDDYRQGGRAAHNDPRRWDDRGPPSSYSQNEVVDTGHRFFGSISQGLANAVEYVFKSQGRPNGYILGEDAGGAFVAGLRYGEGMLHTKEVGNHRVFWQGPSVGYDFGGEGSKTMVLVYNMREPSDIYQRFGGVQGSVYVIGGVSVQFQKQDHVTLAVIRSGVGLRLGANVGYLKYTRRPTWNPF